MALPFHPPDADRPRERLWALGAAALTAAELLAVLLGTGGGGRTCWRSPAAAGSREGSLRRLAPRPAPELLRSPGVGPAKAARLLAALELGSGLRGRCARRSPIREPADVSSPVRSPAPRPHGGGVPLLALDTQSQVLRDVLVTRGILNSSLVHPREVFRAAIAEAAAGIIVVHNHPSGDPTPSAEDRAVTSQLVAAGRLLDMPVYDHVIVAGDRFVSFAAAGLL